jgi:hypothetical protein
MSKSFIEWCETLFLSICILASVSGVISSCDAWTRKCEAVCYPHNFYFGNARHKCICRANEVLK